MDGFSFLTDDILIQVYKQLTFFESAKLALVSRNLCRISNSSLILCTRVQSIIPEIDSILCCKTFWDHTRLVQPLKEYLQQTSLSAFRYDQNTLRGFIKWIGTILKCLKRSLMVRNQTEIDALEPAVCRSMAFFQSTFCGANADVPSRIIKDHGARQLWENAVQSQLFCSFNFFYLNIIKKLPDIRESPPSFQNEFRSLLAYFIDFPEKDLITASKWDFLTQTFGLRAFVRNFARFVMSPGFLGVLSDDRVQELLKNQPANTYLMRFSNSKHDCITICWKTSSCIQQSRNVGADGSIIPLERFWTDMLSRCRPLPLRLEFNATTKLIQNLDFLLFATSPILKLCNQEEMARHGEYRRAHDKERLAEVQKQDPRFGEILNYQDIYPELKTTCFFPFNLR